MIPVVTLRWRGKELKGKTPASRLRIFAKPEKITTRMPTITIAEEQSSIEPLVVRPVLIAGEKIVGKAGIAIGAQIDTGFDHEMDREYKRNETHHFAGPNADPGKKRQRLFNPLGLCKPGNREIAYPAAPAGFPGFDAIACVGGPFTASPPAVPVAGT